MLEQNFEDPFSEHGLERSPLFEAADRLEQSESNYFASCRLYMQKPTTRRLGKLIDTAGENAESFQDYIAALSETEEIVPKFGLEAGNSLLAMDKRRADFMNRVTQTDKFKNLDGDFNIPAPHGDEGPEIDRQTIVNSVSDIYCNSVTQDTQRLVDLIAETPRSKRFEIVERLKPHAFEVGKVALGAGIAIAASRLFTKKDI